MSRDLTAGMKAAIEAQTLIPAFFVSIETLSGTIRVWTGIGDIEWPVSSPAGPIWSGVGELGSISDMGETTETNAMGVKLTLSGIPADMVSGALDELVPGKTAIIYFVLFDTNANIIADPYKSFPGRVDAVDMIEGGQTCAITVSVESLMIDLQLATERRWTAEDQKIDWPDDTGFDFVESLQELNINWGSADQPIPQKQM